LADADARRAHRGPSFPFLVCWSRRRRRLSPAAVGTEAIVGRTGIALGRLDPVALDPVGQVRVGGEIWSARSVEPIDPGAAVTVSSVDGLVLEVERARRASDLM